MQICKKTQLFIAIVLSLCIGNAGALDFPSMPSLSSPAMPEIGGTPYGPWNNAPNSRGTVSSAKEATADSVEPSAAGLALSAETISGLGGLDALSGLTGLTEDSSINSYISALSGLGGFTGTNSSVGSTLESLAESTKSETTNTMLAQILEQLKILSEKTESESTNVTANSAATDSSAQVAVATSLESYSPQTADGSKLLRFKAKGVDLLGSCRTVYFSEPEANGVFLLTGDRVFYIGSQIRNETFYFLFKPAKTENGRFFYNVEAELIQDAAATGSNLFPLTESPALIASRTGNLVTLRHSIGEWSLDMLIDLQEAE